MFSNKYDVMEGACAVCSAQPLRGKEKVMFLFWSALYANISIVFSKTDQNI